MGVLLMGSLPGIAIGSYSALRVPETVLRVTLAAVLILVAGKIGYQELHAPSPTVNGASRRSITGAHAGHRDPRARHRSEAMRQTGTAQH